MTAGTITSSHRSIRRHLGAGLALVAVVAGGVGGWAAFTEISGAVIAPGTLVVDSNVKKVQHSTGGVVGEIHARDGDRVKTGAVVVKLDDTITRANLMVVSKGLDELMARKARLEAERDGAETIDFPEDLLTRSNDPQVSRVLAGERKLFELRHSARSGQKAQLLQRMDQLREEIDGHAARLRANSQEIVLIARELKGARDLWDNKLMPITKLTVLEREATRLDGERGQLLATVAQVKGKIAEIELQIIQLDRELGSEVGTELRQIDAKIGELAERQVVAEDQLKRIDIRAPQDGVVHQSAVHTVGGVITAGETIMLIVPDAESLTVEAKVAPQEIDQLRIGQSAVLRFSAFNQWMTPEINGTVSRISADITIDGRSGQSYYSVRILMPAQEVARLETLRLVPGMPVEVFLQTGERTVLTYLLKPLRDQLKRAFRER